ncbi:hypothetical protein SORBI_3001G439050 [Sorghum bicolor]|uniref:Uncharacterized protein n=1 Tax=Sorghum bicolor TaxID=4558 RepID=A0A1Z5SAG9_SORBI|nr:hypothetical protein SORBI_3001G439050 [Sorghum bicolor]
MQRLTHATSYPKPYDISYLESIERCHPVRRDIVVFSSVSRSSSTPEEPWLIRTKHTSGCAS